MKHLFSIHPGKLRMIRVPLKRSYDMIIAAAFWAKQIPSTSIPASQTDRLMPHFLGNSPRNEKFDNLRRNP
jgi:hypothetical protein